MTTLSSAVVLGFSWLLQLSGSSDHILEDGMSVRRRSGDRSPRVCLLPSPGMLLSAVHGHDVVRSSWVVPVVNGCGERRKHLLSLDHKRYQALTYLAAGI